jgi:hypothetical protein
VAYAGFRKFKDLPVASRVAVVTLGVLQFALLIAAEADVQRRPAGEINGPKRRWRLLCLINFIGPLSYFRWGRRTTP